MEGVVAKKEIGTPAKYFSQAHCILIPNGINCTVGNIPERLQPVK
jgi:hypothetical protein